tara:strand:- start:410822 stop:413239 length:2418 start_codon:yes stop_codon:yes gene_type:complete
MIKLFFKIALRYLMKNKLYSFINIAGLSIGIASFVLIMLYVNFEKSYDKFEGSNQVERVYMDALEGTNFVPSDAQTANLIGPTLKQEFPEVIEQVRLYRFERLTFTYKEQVFEASKGSIADETYFDVFKNPLLKGDPKTVLTAPNAVVLTQDLATKMFGKEEAINKVISAFHNGEKVTLTVTGILKESVQNTHLKTNFLISFKTYENWFASEVEVSPNWSHCNFSTYIKVAPNTDFYALKNKVIARDFEDDLNERYNIEPLEDIHLYSNKPFEDEANGSVSRIKFLTAIAFIILILSWLNYINLSTTKSLERAKEIGIRKVSGAQKTQLILGSLTESVLLNFVAICMAGLLTTMMLSMYRNFTGHQLFLTLEVFWQIVPFVGIIVLGVLAAGLYPAITLSNYSPVKALKGKVRTSAGGMHIRKGLIITQFVATIMLLSGTFMIHKQMNFLQNQPIGAKLSNVIALEGEVLMQKSDSIIRSEYGTMVEELNKLPIVSDVSRAQTFPGGGYENLNSFVGLQYPNGSEDSNTNYYNYSVYGNYFQMLDITFLAGSNFKGIPGKGNRQIIINETSMHQMQLKNPEEAVHKIVKFFGIDWEIAGVIKDYHHFGLKSPIQPLIITHNYTSNLLVKFDESIATTAGYSQALAQVETIWKGIFPRSTFNFTFVDKKFEMQYEADKKFGAAFLFFTILAIFIASLGLFGLTSYTCVQRKKEIGVRKVNGASIKEILSLLNVDFIKWIGLAFLIATPLSWFLMGKWLEGFALKTTVSWWVFVLAGLGALILALLTVSWQSLKAALNNPIEALRNE